MNIKGVLKEYYESKEKNVIITDKDGKKIYESEVMDFPSDIVLEKISKVPEDFEEQEFFDKEREIYLNVKKAVIEHGGERYNCYLINDVSEYTMLIHEVSSYTKRVSNMFRFQTSIMKKLSMSYDNFLPGLADYCNAEEVMMLIKRDGKVTKSLFRTELTRYSDLPEEEYTGFFSVKRGDYNGDFYCILNSKVQDCECAVLVKNFRLTAEINPLDVTVHNVIILFIENSILRDKVVYESEHDKLTGLYNKSKYIAMKKANFGDPATIAIYNFDVNNLKNINDTYGHEYGDSLIVKAAKSIAAVTSDKVYGFRMGGDEYVMVAVNVTREEAEDVRERWKAALDRLNEEDRELFCAMACGLVYGSGDYVYDDLYAQSDQLMYVEKKALKSKNITSHLVKP